MNFDELLDFLFHKWLGVCISICSAVVLMLSLSSCLPLDFCACWCGTIPGCEESANCFDNSSVECDDICFDCFGGAYENSGYREDSSCALNECLFGRYGCQAECGNCFVDCGGVNTSLLIGICEDVGCDYGECSCGGCDADEVGCYTTDDGYDRATCANCLVYCDGTDDPESPNYSPDYLYSIKVIDYYGNEKTVSIYSNTQYVPADSVKGMKFIGYYSQPNGKGVHYEGIPSANTTVYAYYRDAYEGKRFTLEVYSRLQTEINSTIYRDGELLHTFAVYSGDAIWPLVSSLESIDGYYLNKFSIDQYNYYNGGNTIVQIGDTNGIFDQYDPFNPAEYNIPETVSTATFRIYADYDIIAHNVEIVYPGHLSLATTTRAVFDNTPVNDLKSFIYNKTYGNFIFAGFSLDRDSNILLEDDYLITEDTTLYAVYRTAVTLTFKDVEESDATYSYTYPSGQLVELPVPATAPIGMEFSHWVRSDNFSRVNSEFIIDDSHNGMLLIAVYKPAVYTITFYNGEIPIDTLEYSMGATDVFMTLSEEYQEFIGWYKNPDFSGQMYTAIAETDYGDYSLYAKFVPKTYTVELDEVGGYLTNHSVPVSYGQSFTLPVPTRTGYTFAGWYCSTGYSDTKLTDEFGNSLDVFKKYNGYEYQTPNDISIMAFAKWTANSYTITFAGEGIESFTNSCSHGNTISAPTEPSRTGYTFLGWYLGNELYDFENTKVYSDLTITAKFEAKTYTIKLLIDVPGGSFQNSGLTEIEITYVYDSGKITFSDVPVRAGYVFRGWYTAANGSGNLCIRPDGSVTTYLNAFVTKPGANLVLYAAWVLDNN